ncbi:LCP family protein [Cyanobium sp. Alchichica 3B3-8F6]|uniref:LCP family protein n=1 Tax=Cyanobium sp. Alchichica 3B3-8F6 TaxID=2823696 RepID=UPI0020CCBAAF|nr:LCP family protein [Cyanobium sp. Alchichica 3B3-8F6]MCP9881162.1 LCP family protein [Cyanobium sp. Alchichica 3B3-8F6]
MRTPQAKGPRKRSRRGSVLVAICVGLGGGLLLAGPLWELLSENGAATNNAITNPFAAWSGITNLDILLLGTDVGGGNTDVIASLRVDGGITRITQVPRDTYIEAEGYGPHKINALYSLGGTDLVKRELARKLGRPITHHVVVNLAAIRRMADALGGIEVDVPKRMAYTDHSQGLTIDLQPGLQTLKGRDLEGFLRFRHDAMGDIGRLERQQLALQALFRKLTRPEHLVRLPVLLAAAGKDLKTDLGPMELGGLITAMGTTQLETKRLGGRPFYRNNISYWEADWPQPVLDSSAGYGSGDDGRFRFLF